MLHEEVVFALIACGYVEWCSVLDVDAARCELDAHVRVLHVMRWRCIVFNEVT